MFKLIIKVCVIWLLSNNAYADTTEAETKNKQSIQICPETFYSLPLLDSAKFCQQFSTTPPASMSYFAADDQQTTKTFYLKNFGPAEKEQILKGRIVLQYEDGNKIVIISTDGQGSQIDILIKS
ncbi:hypothetical protein [Paraglaciecola sp. L3A3]|uniref:hypothetical protein n=1 Tax=Paraglaciecola sp. L3A3 TaxID=2686358 RepID=UPI00131C1E50|nr:hypothetical protein [Paraglaciecola sp. L3A3]